MANPAQRGSAPDDDSWGKIASDLFGIQFNDDDDFELPDDEAPVAEPRPVTSDSGASATVAAFIEESNSEAGFEETEAAISEPAEAEKKPSVAGNEDHDEFWDILESWNWDESAKPSPTSRRTEEPQGRRGRSETSGSESRRTQREDPPRREPAPRRDEPARREEPPRRVELPRTEVTRSESPHSEPTRSQTPRGEEPPRRDEKRREQTERPRRRPIEAVEETVSASDDDGPKSQPVREESRRERPPRSEQPPRARRVPSDRPATDRPAAERPATERPPSAKRPQTERRPERAADRPRTREASSQFVGNDFGSGVDEPIETPRPRQPQTLRQRDDKPTAPPRKPATARKSEPEDDFEGDLFLTDSDDEFVDEANLVESDESAIESEEGENGPPRRRRRRRRRGRGRATSDSASVSADLESDDSGDIDEPVPFDDAEEEMGDVESADEGTESEEEREVRRPRRRRRRRGRRPETPVAAENEAEDLEDESGPDYEDDEEERDEIEGIESESDSEESDEEIVLPVSYEGIPTWEEAISYLVIVPPTESRGSYRGRQEGHRRDDSRRR